MQSIDTIKDAKEVIMYDNVLEDHFKTYENSRPKYAEVAERVFLDIQLLRNISLSNKSRILTVLLHNLDRELFNKIKTGMD